MSRRSKPSAARWPRPPRGNPNVCARLIIVEPGHFHATLLQKDMYPWLDQRVAVYAPLGPELLDYLGRVVGLQHARGKPHRVGARHPHQQRPDGRHAGRASAATSWSFTGKNRAKIDRILAALRAGLNVLADKPWIITSADLPKLEEALAPGAREEASRRTTS